ncbi:MAG: PorT family protein [Sphingobacteriales bacterium JAD_PAG50586_3]|nr:MAG: PorT family protein [Sphingobacteriales bacterium JAD_PAG50586_3]
MKKLLALLALAITTTTYGQVSNEVGIVAGPNIHYRINNNADGMYSSGLGFTGGITNNLYFGSHSSIYAALMYERRTEVQTKFFFIDFPPYPTKAVFTDDYISVPILYRYTMGKKP